MQHVVGLKVTAADACTIVIHRNIALYRMSGFLLDMIIARAGYRDNIEIPVYHATLLVAWFWELVPWPWELVAWSWELVAWSWELVAWSWELVAWFWELVAWSWELVAWSWELVAWS